MVRELCYETIADVVETWEMAKQNPCFEETTAMAILQKLIEIEPRTKAVFGLPIKDDVRKSQLHRLGALIHAKRMMQMLDSVFDLLGPDTESLSEILEQLGKRHVQYGVKASFFPFMGKAIIYSLKEQLGEKVWNDRIEESWVEVYEELSSDIMKSILNNEP
mmetsp:Transcript_10265/g.13557  ORF Transcript_10265/g.13557 Transcript_10265/m.13557 type:complete len:162 (-) Transcript_10265:124-609(-)